MIFIRDNQKLNHTSWWDKMYVAHLENGRFSILHGYECIFRLKNQNLYNSYYSIDSLNRKSLIITIICNTM